MSWSSDQACMVIGELVSLVYLMHVYILCSLSLALSLSDIDLSTCAWHLIHDVCLFLDGERVFDLSERGQESRDRSKHHSDVVVPARLSDPLTNLLRKVASLT